MFFSIYFSCMKIKNKSTKFSLSCCHFKIDGKEYENIYNFVNGDYKVYPPEFSENDKRSLRQKGKNYRIKQNELYYIHFDKKLNETTYRLVITAEVEKSAIFVSQRKWCSSRC